MTADDIAQFQTGTHPGLTASPIAYQLVNAAEMAIIKSNSDAVTQTPIELPIVQKQTGDA